MDWMAVSSYGSGTKSSGVVRILKDLDTDILDRHVLIVEDIVDSGLTLSWLVSNPRSRNPASLESCALLRKPQAVKTDVNVTDVGFDLPNEFVIGYGLDYAEKYRNLPFVGTLAPHVYGGNGGERARPRRPDCALVRRLPAVSREQGTATDRCKGRIGGNGWDGGGRPQPRCAAPAV